MNSKLKFKSKFFYYALFTLGIFICILFSFSGTCFAGYPKLVNNIVSAFEKVEKYIVAIATPASISNTIMVITKAIKVIPLFAFFIFFAFF